MTVRETGQERVRDAMVTRPKTLPADATVRDLRRLLANPRLLTVLLVEGTAFAGAVEREDVGDELRGDAPARALAAPEVETIGPDAPLQQAVERLNALDARRLVVLDADGTSLAGLLCLKGDRAGFCSG
jgi:CBS domain-containing protein